MKKNFLFFWFQREVKFCEGGNAFIGALGKNMYLCTLKILGK
jgi:hypothetical protein